MQVLYWGFFTQINPADYFEEDSPYCALGALNAINQGGDKIYPEVRDAINDDSAIIIVNPENNVIEAVSNGVLIPVPFNRALYELVGQTEAETRPWLGKVFNSEDGTVSDPPPPPVMRITPAQGRIWLLRNNKLTQAEATVEQAGGELAIWYEYATEWDYTAAPLDQFCAALGIDKRQAFDEAALIIL